MRGNQRSRFRVGIVADDLTSAADCGAPFLAAGLSVFLGTGGHVPQAGLVRAVDTGSRSLLPEEGARITAEVTRELADAGILFKSVDSTLRGSIGSEILAAFEVSRRRQIVIAPAFPEAGRTTRKGVQYVDGVRVDRSVYARDPVHAVTQARLEDLLPRELGEVVVLSVDSLGGLAAPSGSGEGVFIVDAESQQELEAIVSAVPDTAGALWVGSPGLARALATELLAGRGQVLPTGVPCQASRALVVSGSANAVSHAQVGYLRELGIPTFEPGERSPGSARVRCLHTPQERSVAPEALREQLADHAARELEEGDYDALLISGGDTAARILQRLRVASLELAKEVVPGLVVGRAQAPRPLVVALKAGGLGSREALGVLLAQLIPDLGVTR